MRPEKYGKICVESPAKKSSAFGCVMKTWSSNKKRNGERDIADEYNLLHSVVSTQAQGNIKAKELMGDEF